MSRVLIVEDELLLLEGLCEEARALGWEPLRATRGEEAVQVLGGGMEVEVVLLDHHMPDWSGLETAAVLQRLRPGIQIALVTAERLEGFDPAAHGVVTVLGKPLDPGSLAEFLGRVRKPIS